MKKSDETASLRKVRTIMAMCSALIFICTGCTHFVTTYTFKNAEREIVWQDQYHHRWTHVWGVLTPKIGRLAFPGVSAPSLPPPSDAPPPLPRELSSLPPPLPPPLPTPGPELSTAAETSAGPSLPSKEASAPSCASAKGAEAVGASSECFGASELVKTLCRLKDLRKGAEPSD